MSRQTDFSRSYNFDLFTNGSFQLSEIDIGRKVLTKYCLQCVTHRIHLPKWKTDKNLTKDSSFKNFQLLRTKSSVGKEVVKLPTTFFVLFWLVLCQLYCWSLFAHEPGLTTAKMPLGYVDIKLPKWKRCLLGKLLQRDGIFQSQLKCPKVLFSGVRWVFLQQQAWQKITAWVHMTSCCTCSGVPMIGMGITRTIEQTPKTVSLFTMRKTRTIKKKLHDSKESSKEIWIERGWLYPWEKYQGF